VTVFAVSRLLSSYHGHSLSVSAGPPTDIVYSPAVPPSDMTGGVHHVGTTVAELERAVDFYTETCDLGVHAEFDASGEAISTGFGD
jgi:hypothetical protein